MGVFLMVVHGSDGDLLPVLRIGRVLRDRGHEVTVLTHSKHASRVRRTGLSCVPVDLSGGRVERSDDHELVRAVAGEARLFSSAAALVPQVRFECRALARRHRPGRTVLVGSCTLSMSVLTAGEALGAPVACVAIAPYFLDSLPDQARALRDSLGEDVGAVRSDLGLPPVPDWAAWLASADAYLGLWPDWFDRAGPPASVHTRLIGFVMPDGGADDDTVPSAAADALAGPTRPILITGGTSPMLHRDFYPAALAAVAGLDRPILLVAGDHDLPDGPLPATVLRFRRLPFASVIPGVAAVIHHGGIGTAACAAAAGVAQVVLGYGFDRADNGARLAAAGAGAYLPAGQWSPERIRSALDTVLAAPPPAPFPTGATADPATLAADELERLG